MGNEQIIRQCLEIIRERKLARTPANMKRIIEVEGLPFEGDYEALSILFWQTLDDPEWEARYKEIVGDI